VSVTDKNTGDKEWSIEKLQTMPPDGSIP